jgi:hypothetical protein
MKKILGLLTVIIFLISLTLAQSGQDDQTLQKGSSKDLTPKIDEKLEKEIAIPQGLHTLTRVGLGINPEENIKISKLITIVTLWLLIFVATFTAISSFSILGPLSKVIASITMTMIIGSTKAIAFATEQWLLNEKFFIYINGWSFGNLIINMVAIIIAAIAILFIREKMKKEQEKDKEEKLLDGIKKWFSRFRK